VLTFVIARAEFPEPTNVARDENFYAAAGRASAARSAAAASLDAPRVSSTSSRTCGRMIRGAAVATRGGMQESYRRSHGDGRSQSCPAGIRTGGPGIGSRARSGGRSRRGREIAPDGCAPLKPRRPGATVRSTRSHRPAGGAGGGTGAARRRPACRCSFAAMRIWPISAPSPRRSGSCSSTSTTSTRRFPACGNGREAFGSQRCCRRPRERLRG
jgi:hypothetical protein